VETKRLETLDSLDVTGDYNYDYLPMSMFWLLPQFVLLGVVDGISHNLFSDGDKISSFSIACFCNGEVPDSINYYLQIFSSSVFGFGNLGSV
jgi:hypothetical protein